MALPLFCHGLGDDLGLEALLGIHFLEATIFLFQLFEASHEGGVHATEFGAPLVESSGADAMLTAQLGDG